MKGSERICRVWVGGGEGGEREKLKPSRLKNAASFILVRRSKSKRRVRRRRGKSDAYMKRAVLFMFFLNWERRATKNGARAGRGMQFNKPAQLPTKKRVSRGAEASFQKHRGHRRLSHIVNVGNGWSQKKGVRTGKRGTVLPFSLLGGRGSSPLFLEKVTLSFSSAEKGMRRGRSRLEPGARKRSL